MSGFTTGVGFLTRVPLRGAHADLARAAPWFPVVGAVIGLAVGGAYAGLGHLVPAVVAAAVAILFGVLVTGVFHEDGLADVADAFAGGWTQEDRLRILKDPRHGSYGVAALSGSIVLRIVTLATFGPASGFAACVCAHALGRSAAVGTMALTAPTTRSGLGSQVFSDARRPALAIGALAGLALAAVATGWWSLPAALAAGVGAAVMVWLAARKIGGVNGDVLGAIEQIGECVTLVVLSGLAARHPIWWR